MPTLSRFRSLVAVAALAAAAAACADGSSPVASGTAPAEPGRILRPDQAAQLRPGDFIVLRPEEYAEHGITGAGLSPEARGAIYGRCFERLDGTSTCDPCLYSPDCLTGPTGPTPTPTPTAPAASFTFGSDAAYQGWVNTGGTLLKRIRLVSFSQSGANVASFSVSAAFKSVGAASGCGNVAGAFDFDAASGAGSPLYVEVSRVGQWLGTIKWQVDGTHAFTAVSGATGGGTFFSTDGFCG